MEEQKQVRDWTEPTGLPPRRERHGSSKHHEKSEEEATRVAKTLPHRSIFMAKAIMWGFFLLVAGIFTLIFYAQN